MTALRSAALGLGLVAVLATRACTAGAEPSAVAPASSSTGSGTGPIPQHRDGTTSEKLFAPGYGEVFTSSATELETMALVVPADALSGPVPAEIVALATDAAGLFDATRAQDWTAAATRLDGLAAAWTTVRGGDVPVQTREFLDGTLAALIDAVGARDRVAAGQYGVDALRYGLDLQLRYRPAPEIDLARMDVWGRQLLLDAAAADPAGLVHGDVAALKYVRDRVLGDVDRADLTELDQLIHDLAEAAEGSGIAAVTTTTAALLDTVAAIRPVS